ncbi:YqzK family protein [Bacillus sp. 03113]|uniref:YqzK family protein n=1 Tax=Bacillus sp. 03113 TaxID=2578211 RepID=UPI001143723C|nr:YqzK family protein [Bacillus sp. 03113]
MAKWTKLILYTIKVFILFTGCTILFYYGIMWLNEEYQDYHRYDEPKGAAIKVSTANQDEEDWLHRFILFYQIGE